MSWPDWNTKALRSATVQSKVFLEAGDAQTTCSISLSHSVLDSLSQADPCQRYRQLVAERIGFLCAVDEFNHCWILPVACDGANYGHRNMICLMRTVIVVLYYVCLIRITSRLLLCQPLRQRDCEKIRSSSFTLTNISRRPSLTL